jgi:curved DNA-binding protein CbpA
VHHPDRNGGVQSDEFIRLKQAYDNLIDPAKRQNYDAFHDSGEFKKDGRPMSAKEAAWLVDQQKRSWGVKEIHPFAVCILCDSCPCPADAVCDGYTRHARSNRTSADAHRDGPSVPARAARSRLARAVPPVRPRSSVRPLPIVPTCICSMVGAVVA